MFSAIHADAAGKFRMRKQIAYLEGASLHGMHQNTGELVNDLVRNASYGPCNCGFSFPQCFYDGQTESFPF